MSKHRLTTLFFITFLLLLALTSHFAVISGWVFFIVIFVWFIFVVIGSSTISLNYHISAYCGNDNEKRKIIALTFDDGPNESTEAILKVLEAFDAKATFFCIGKNIKKNPEIFKKIISAGHLAGNHTYHHSPFFDMYRKNRVLKEIEETDKLMQQLIGKKISLFRPPYGVTNPSIRRALAVSKHKVIGWNIRSYDTIIKDEQKLFKRIKSRIKPGGIILMHDSAEHTVKVLKQLLLFLHEQDYKVVSVEQLLNIAAYED